MALNAITWASDIKSALDSAGLLTGLTSEEKDKIEAGWVAIATGHVTHITTNAITLTTGVTAVGPPGGPLPITLQPGIIT